MSSIGESPSRSESFEFSKNESFAILGAGRVGLTFGTLLKNAGHKIVGCSARSASSLERAATAFGCPSSTDAREVIVGASAIVLTVPDDAIERTAESISDLVDSGTVAFHTSGTMGLEPLRALAEAGAQTLAVHVLQSIPGVEAGLRRIPGSWFGVTCPPDARTWAEGLVLTLGGKVLWLEEKDRAAYHAAAVMASNYLVGLSALVEQVGGAVDPYLPLMEGTLANIKELGVAGALTGPVARGDAGTVARHISMLRANSPLAENAYRALALVVLESAEKAGLLDDEAAAAVREALE
ncbi:MAG TPA: DUF2520 domain-containing protein [Actinomycetota bacterium]|nr:DUF2520 domain-containing protein [Actinomycetota bacterium]